MSTYSVSSRFAPKKTLTWAELSQFKDGIPNLTQTINGVTTTCPPCLDVEQDTGDVISIDIVSDNIELFSAKANSDTNGIPTYSSFVSDEFSLLSRHYTYIMTLTLNANDKIPFAQRSDGIGVSAKLFTYTENGIRSYTNDLKLTPIINDTADTTKTSSFLTIKENDYWSNWADTHVSLATAVIKIDTAYVSGTISSAWRSVHNIALTIQGN